jgi:hypothetical protein
VEEEKESLACYLGYGEKREGLLALCLDFSSYYWFLQESQKIGRQQAASPCDARSEQQVCCLLAD